MADERPLDASRLSRLEALFTAAREIAPAERSAWLARELPADLALRREVEELLSCDRPTGALERGVLGDLREFASDAEECPAAIAGHRVLRRIGMGGMGVVFEVEQSEPRRRIALKLMRGWLAPSARERFAREIELLARLDHPHIAKILFAGRTESDQPYLAMELVEGPTLAAWAGSGPSRTRRLELLEKLARAVEHAHQRGVLHRDLKPANILVAANDEPKIIDFGVARLVEESSGTQLTADRELVGTLPYMSPERFQGPGATVDTRADVYALGVIGYELLCGRLPYDFEGKGLTEVVRMLLHAEPVPLSRRDPALRGDLEAIIARACAPEPERRYPSASLLALDLEHLRRDEPVSASSTTRFYLLRKLVRRHRGLAAGVLVAALSLVAGLVVALLALEDARRAESEARAAEARADRERQTAVLEAQAADEVSRRLAFVLETPASAGLSGDLRFADVLDLATVQLGSELEVRPEIEARVRGALARAFLLVGRIAQAEAQLDRLRASGVLESAEWRQRLKLRLTSIELHFRSQRFAAAEDEARRLLAEKTLAEHPASDEALLTRDLAWRSACAQGKAREVTEEARRFLALAQELGGNTVADRLFGASQFGLATAELALQNYAGAKAAMDRALVPNVMRALLQHEYWKRRDVELRGGVVDARLALRDAGRPLETRSLFGLARALCDLDQPARAVPLLVEALEQVRAREPLNSDELATGATQLGLALRALGREDEVLPWMEEALAAAQRSMREDRILNARVNVTIALHRAQRFEEMLERSEGLDRDLERAKLGPQLYDVVRMRGIALGRLQRFEEGEASLLRAVRLAEANGRQIRVMPELVELYEAWGKPEEAGRWRAAGR
ncbi:MAG: serine/threonine protein kinase [Planctomycetes bacterium]|nr:serine/threonine protein kinase [Planctomycetota bacterium]